MRCVALLFLLACGGKLPETRYYQLAEPKPAPAQRAGVPLVIEPLVTDPAYDDERIVYRVTPYRLDYYNYHRWTSAPGMMVSNYLERAFEHSGKFSAVTHEPNAAAPITLGGRIIAIEEIDQSKTKWVGRIVIELTATDSNDKVVWSQQYEEIEPLPSQSPEGLARALSTALERIALRAVPIIAVLAEEQSKVRQARESPPGRQARR